MLHTSKIGFRAKRHVQVQHWSYFWNRRTVFASHSLGYFNLNGKQLDLRKWILGSTARLQQTFAPERNFTSALCCSFFLPSLTFSFPPPFYSSFTPAPLMSVYGEACVQLVTVSWQKGMSCKSSPVFASPRSISTRFKAAHLNRFVSLTESCCDILVSLLIYNFVFKCVVAVKALPLFIYLFIYCCKWLQLFLLLRHCFASCSFVGSFFLHGLLICLEGRWFMLQMYVGSIFCWFMLLGWLSHFCCVLPSCGRKTK